MKLNSFPRTPILILALSILPFQKASAQFASDPELKAKYHQFDFWIGEWEVYKYGTDSIVGYSQIMSINDSTALLENYRVANNPYQGKSLNTYNRATGKWEQYWTDNGGLVLKLEGVFSEGAMTLHNTDGTKGNKITWRADKEGNVRQTWEISTNGGKAWETVFDGLYRKITP